MSTGDRARGRSRVSTPTRRGCLACARTFISQGPGNRICPDCDVKNGRLSRREQSTSRRPKGLDVDDSS